MAITYPLALPTVNTFARVALTPRSVVGMAASPFTLQQQAQVFAGQQWLAELALPRMPRAIAEVWVAFLLKLNGREGSFLLGDPTGAQPRGVATGAPLVNGAGQTGNSLVTDGWSAGVTNILRAGDWLQLGSGSGARLHKNLNDVASDGGGNATLDIWPSLRASPGDNAPITVIGAQGKFMLATNTPSWSIEEAVMYGIAFAAIEDLRP